jgi:hypothetical protein
VRSHVPFRVQFFQGKAFAILARGHWITQKGNVRDDLRCHRIEVCSSLLMSIDDAVRTPSISK